GLLLEHGADPGVRDTGYHATPAGWAEHHGQHEAHDLLAALEQPDVPASVRSDASSAVASSAKGAALRTVTATFTAVSEARFDDLGGLLASDIDWRGVADEDGQIPRCQGRDQALARMRIGLLANAKVSVSSLVEEGDRVIAHVHSAAEEEVKPPERYVVAEVHDGQITHLSGFASESEALDALHAAPAPGSRPTNSSPRPEAGEWRSGLT
ncbi:MAG: nuclear transport factor 2 family protein, partial [Solirubrobacteraceae bacterium]